MAIDMEGTTWQHYKGGLYRVVCLGKRESDGVDVVIYRAIYGDNLTTWVRPLSEWNSKTECKHVECGGGCDLEKPRYKPITIDAMEILLKRRYPRTTPEGDLIVENSETPLEEFFK